jgi:PAS domain S-box-containing protein
MDMRTLSKRQIQDLLFAVAITAAAALVRAIFHPFLDARAPLTPFVLAVLAAAWRGGWWPGVLATVLGAFASSVWLIKPIGTFVPQSTNDWYRFLFFGVSAFAITFVCEALRRANRRAEERQRELDQVANSTPLMLVRCDRDLRYVFVNRAGQEFLGRKQEDIVGRRIVDVLGDDALRRIRPYIDRVLAGEDVEFEIEIPYPVAGNRFMHVQYTPDRDDDGHVVGWFATLTDISVRKRAEDAVREANHRKEEFIAILAHELRNPLAPVRNAAHFLRLRNLPDPEVHRPIEMIERQVAQMARLIDDLLDVSRISRGVLELRLERLMFRDIADAVVDMCRDEVDARGHTLRVVLPEIPVPLDADRQRLIQAFCNLVSNAAKYTPPEGHLEFVARVRGGILDVQVRDNGIGIPADKLADIFELFTQVDRSLERHGGLGIGLTLARQLIQLHGGSILAESGGPGRGSTFVVQLPVAVGVPAAGRSARDVSERVAESKRVLVADDNRDAADSLALILELSGHVVQRALDGEEAIAIAEQFRPEFAFIDIGMPRVNGYDVARRIRREEWGHTMHLVALTGWGQEEDRRKAIEAGFNAHYVKPMEPQTLNQLLAGPSAAREPSATLASYEP